MASRIVFILHLFLLVVALATGSEYLETGECVTGADGEACTNPDAPTIAQEKIEGIAQKGEAEAYHGDKTLEEDHTESEEGSPQQPDATLETENIKRNEPEPSTTVEDEVTETSETTDETPPLDESGTVTAEDLPPPGGDEPDLDEKREEQKSVTDDADEESGEENSPSCPSRKHVIKCAAQYLDKNNNKLLERSELQDAIDSLPWFSRGILNILGSVDKMMAKCDIDGDGAIGIDFDMQHNSETCLATCFKRRAFKGAFFPDCKA